MIIEYPTVFNIPILAKNNEYLLHKMFSAILNPNEIDDKWFSLCQLHCGYVKVKQRVKVST